MQNEINTISRYQLLCLGFISLLSPIIRLLPQEAVFYSGSRAWLSSILAIVPLSILFLLTMRFFKNALQTEGFAELFIKSLGKGLGRTILLIFTLWFLFYIAFLLRTSAERYVTTIYSQTPPSIFICILLALSMIAALGAFRNLARTAQVFLPILALTLLFIFIFAFSDVDLKLLAPVTMSDVPTVLKGIPAVTSVLSLSVYIGFMEGRVREKEKRTSSVFIWLLLMLATIILLCITVLGTFGAELVEKLSFPFFAMIRNITVFSFLERLESAVLALWVLTDFMIISILLFVVTNNLRVVFSLSPDSAERKRFFDLSDGRYLIWICAIIILVLALTMAPSAKTLLKLSGFIVPIINIGFTYLLLPAVIIIGIARKRV